MKYLQHQIDGLRVRYEELQDGMEVYVGKIVGKIIEKRIFIFESAETIDTIVENKCGEAATRVY